MSKKYVLAQLMHLGGDSPQGYDQEPRGLFRHVLAEAAVREAEGQPDEGRDDPGDDDYPLLAGRRQHLGEEADQHARESRDRGDDRPDVLAAGAGPEE